MMTFDISQATILIVDDSHANVVLLEHTLRGAGYHHFVSTTNPRDVAGLVRQSAPDLIILDINMPGMSGFEVMAALKPSIPADTYLPVLALTGLSDDATRHRALREGASDFVSKTDDPTELLQRSKNLLHTRFLYKAQQAHSATLSAAVATRTQELARANRKLEELSEDVLSRLARAAEYSDDASETHTRRVGQLSFLTARQLGLPSDFCDLILSAARLHDVGKIGIPDGILLRPGQLTEDEQLYLREHCIIGAELLSGGQSELLKMAESIALTHHERWDGQGYPSKLVGEHIPVEGRIVAVVDVFDTLTHTRPYRRAWHREEALVLLQEESGRHFDPAVVAAFLKVAQGINDTKESEDTTDSRGNLYAQTHF